MTIRRVRVLLAAVTAVGLAVVLAAQNPVWKADAINLGVTQIVGGAPDVRDWSKTTAISRVQIGADGVAVDFDAKSRWPDVRTPGWDGDLQYTLWLFVKRNGNWVGSGVIEYWRNRPSSGSFTQPTIAAHVSENWIHDGHWGFDYTLYPGEPVAFMVTAGDQRVKDVHVVAERSNVVIVPLESGTYTFDSPAPTPSPVPAPAPVPVPEPAPVPAPAIDLSPIYARLDRADARFVQTDASLEDLRKLVASLQDAVSALSTRLDAVPIFATCKASVNIGVTRIPISCSLGK